MTVKTLKGTITASEEVLNVLSIGYDKMAESYKEDGLELISVEMLAVSHEIYSALEKSGFYERPFSEKEEKPKSGNSLKVRRNILMDDVRSMCIRYGFYTKGNCKDYDAMLSSCNGYVSDDVLEQTAIDIVEHSSKDSLEAAFDVPFDPDSMSYYITCIVEMLVNNYSRTVAFY